MGLGSLLGFSSGGMGNAANTSATTNNNNQSDSRRVNTGGSGGINIADTAAGGVTVNSTDAGAFKEAVDFAKSSQTGMADVFKGALDFSKAVAAESTGFAKATQTQAATSSSSNLTVLYVVLALAGVMAIAVFRKR